MKKGYLRLRHTLAYKMVPSIDVLGAHMMLGIASECFRSFVVDVQRKSGEGADAKLVEKVSQPEQFLA